MFPRVISLKFDRGLLGAGMTLSRIAGAFVAQLSTRAANQAQVLYDYSTGKITRVEAMTQLGVDCRELLRIMADSKIPMPRPTRTQFDALAKRMLDRCVKAQEHAPRKKTPAKRPGIARKTTGFRLKAR
ncbi:hypothetical protein BWI17_18360 [Betaproteobacteria bacterium GR16-43]|nr:hypothetical protein BWI17_18360 [Betaproteobacteria bacterium GR16-43]